MRYKQVFLLSLLFIALFPIISAQIYGGPVEGLQIFLDGILRAIDVFSEFLFAVGIYDEFLFAKFLLGIIIFVVCIFGIEKSNIFGNKKGIIRIIALAITILAIRYIPDSGFIHAMILPYTVLGVAVSVIIPLIIFFFFIHNVSDSSVWRRVGWIFFGTIFAVIWYNRYTQIGPIGNQIYFWLLVVVFALILFDRKISVYFALHEIRGMENKIADKAILNLLDELAQAQKYAGTPYGDSRIKDIKKSLKSLGVSKV